MASWPVCFFYFIASQYNLVIDTHVAVGRSDEATSVSIGFAVLGWFGMWFIGGVNNKIIGLAFIAELAYVLTFIHSVAPISKYVSSSDDRFWNGMYGRRTGQLVGRGSLVQSLSS